MKPEIRVGILVVATAVVLVLFGWLIGIKNPFQATQTLYLTYHFAGGIEVGSPVRVSGIKVGRVEKIEFFSEMDAKSAPKEPGSPEDELEGKEVVPVKLRISIRNDAARGIREDSKFYINLAGIIGERYIEITPGSKTAKPLKAGAVVAGVGPQPLD
jgi:phospholipid/cholesterol/gamma-HCH transport system substrate-binding protein